jgi:prevent-host-death family protein
LYKRPSADVKSLTVSDARARLPALIDAIAEEEVVITRRGKPVAKLVPYTKAKSRDNRHPLRRLPIKIAEDFDEPMPGVWEALE